MKEKQTNMVAKAPVQNVATATDNDEGEPQSRYLNPPSGGAYTRNKDGSLTRNAHPTKVPDTIPIDDQYRRIQEEGVEERPMQVLEPVVHESKSTKE